MDDYMDLEIDGVVMPSPALEGVTITPTSVWNSTAGRLEATAEFAGKIIAIKYSISIKWPTLTMAEAKIITDAVVNLTAMHTIRLRTVDGSVKTFTGYFELPGGTIYSYVDGLRYVTGMALNFVEQ